MADNPYHPPQYAAHSGLDPLDVVVQSRFPLVITANRVVNIDTEALGRRVQFAAQACGYTFETRGVNKWALCRGSLWHAVFTFDVRKLPTTVAIEVISPTRLHIDLRCQSAISIATPGDARRISLELDELERQLLHGG